MKFLFVVKLSGSQFDPLNPIFSKAKERKHEKGDLRLVQETHLCSFLIGIYPNLRVKKSVIQGYT